MDYPENIMPKGLPASEKGSGLRADGTRTSRTDSVRLTPREGLKSCRADSKRTRERAFLLRTTLTSRQVAVTASP